MCEHVRSFINMLQPIEFFEIPERCKLEVEFRDGTTQEFDCRVDISHNAVVQEVYDKDDEIIATTLGQLCSMGAVKVTVKAYHEVDLSVVI